MATTVASALQPVLDRLFHGAAPPIGFRFWDGTTLGPSDAKATVVLRSPMALRRILYAPGELGFGRAYVAGELDVDGDIFAAFDLRALMGGEREHVEVHLDGRGLAALARAAKRIGVLGPPPKPPLEEARLRGRLHSKERDAAAIAHHYDVGNYFYRTVLGPTMAYSCAYWSEPDMTLEEAQDAKFDIICRKLDLRPGMRMLDVGCGWGGLALHAARHYGVEVIGVSLAKEQVELATERVADAGLGGQIEIRFQDYRDVTDGPFDAISSVGMFEHVGREQLTVYLAGLRDLLVPRGRLLNHAISSPDTKGGKVPPRSFIGRYVFPDGELMEVGRVVTAMQDLGFEVRDVESLREHYARTLRAWVGNLETNWNDLVDRIGPNRARVWRLYMAASAMNFEANRVSVHQVLAVNTPDDGGSGFAATRADFVAGP